MLVTLSCLTLCDPMDYSLPASSVHGILHARILEWVAISPRDLLDPRIEPGPPALQAYSLPSEPPGKTKKTVHICTKQYIIYNICVFYVIGMVANVISCNLLQSIIINFIKLLIIIINKFIIYNYITIMYIIIYNYII